MKKTRVLMIVAACAWMAACTDEPGATVALRAAGYSDIRFTGYSWLGCGKGDGWATSFTATGANGQRVAGVVCAGLMKGSTIRTWAP